LSISWKNGKLAEATILSGSGEPCEVRYGESVLKFKTKRGGSYKVKLDNDRLKLL
jgi:alpha-L-fucosidase 2